MAWIVHRLLCNLGVELTKQNRPLFISLWCISCHDSESHPEQRCHSLTIVAMQGRNEVTCSPSHLLIWHHLFSSHQGTLTMYHAVALIFPLETYQWQKWSNPVKDLMKPISWTNCQIFNFPITMHLNGKFMFLLNSLEYLQHYEVNVISIFSNLKVVLAGK